MGSFAIGDVHGCYNSLMKLMEEISYNPEQDQLYFLGDLINKGPSSLKVLRWVKEQPKAYTLLGNHELHILRENLSYQNKSDFHHKSLLFRAFLNAKDGRDLLDWIYHWPVCIYLDDFKILMFHAALHFEWTLQQVLDYTQDIQQRLLNHDRTKILEKCHHILQDVNDSHKDILNIITRARYWSLVNECYDYSCTAPPGQQPSSLIPWYEHRHQRSGIKHIFGHWASLKGSLQTDEFVSLDAGCVWGGALMAYDMTNCKSYQVPCYDQMTEKK